MFRQSIGRRGNEVSESHSVLSKAGPYYLLSLPLTFPEVNQIPIHCPVNSARFPFVDTSEVGILAQESYSGPYLSPARIYLPVLELTLRLPNLNPGDTVTAQWLIPWNIYIVRIGVLFEYKWELTPIFRHWMVLTWFPEIWSHCFRNWGKSF